LLGRQMILKAKLDFLSWSEADFPYFLNYKFRFFSLHLLV